MSQFSPNPYQHHSHSEEVASNYSDIGGLTKTILILFILFGVTGVLGGCFGLINLAVTSASTLNSPQAAGNQAAAEESQTNFKSLPSGTQKIQLVNYQRPSSESIFVDDTPSSSIQDRLATKIDDSLLGYFQALEGVESGDSAPSEVPSLDGHSKENIDAKGASQLLLRQPFPGSTVLLFLFGLISLIVSAVMLVGGILGLQRKRKGLELVRWSSAFMIPFKFFETGFSVIYNYLKRHDIAAFASSQNQQTSVDPEQFSKIIEVVLILGIGLTIVWSLLLIGFYIFVYVHTSKESIRAKFQ